MTWASIANDTLPVSFKNSGMKHIFTNWCKDTGKESSEALFQKDHSDAGDMEKE